ncbi:MAG: HAMP domain-containing sensor histidine kinase [Thermosynechococcaceae cyanobacterium]
MNVLWFLCGLVLGVGFWYWSSQRWQQQLSQLVRLFPSQAYSATMPLQVRLIKAVQFQQQSEQSLQQRIGIWQTILQTAPIGYLEVDAEGCLYWHNAKAAELLNIASRKYLSFARRSLLQVIRSYELDRLVETVRQTQTPQSLDWLRRSLQAGAQMQELPLRGSAFPLQNGHIGVFLEDRWEATHLMEERDRWTSDVAHELKTPLTSIRLIAETLQPIVDPTLQIWTDRLIQETVRLSGLVQDILELSQIAFQNPHDLKFTDADLPRLIQDAWITLEPLAQPKNLSLYYEGPEHYIIRAEASRLLRVLLNLIDNAIKFSLPDQAIEICVRPNAPPIPLKDASESGLWTQIDIVDWGEGFPEGTLEHVFKRFYKADLARERSTTQWGSQGSGLGLAIAQQIVLAHGGTIQARNHPDHKGAWIQILLPPTESNSHR